jgi:hypothetical protein
MRNGDTFFTHLGRVKMTDPVKNLKIVVYNYDAQKPIFPLKMRADPH